MTNHLMTYRQLCERLQIPIGTAYAWVHQGRIPHIRLTGRSVRFDPVEIDTWLLERRKVVEEVHDD
ncbi:MAG: helix-turn-helix domain-containing protein [Pseudomonadota bacterium]